MCLKKASRYGRVAGLLVFVVIIGCTLGGCPVDVDDLAAKVLEAGLDSIGTSLVDSLSTYLAGN